MPKAIDKPQNTHWCTEELSSKYKKCIKDGNKVLLNYNSIQLFGVLLLGVERKFIMSKTEHPFAGGWTDQDSITIVIHKEFSMPYYVIVCLHEMIHIFSKHVTRGEGKDPTYWNLAADHVVNRSIIDVSEKCKILKNDIKKVFYIKKMEREHPGASVEKVYEELMKNKERYGIKEIEVKIEIPGSGDGDSGGSGEGKSDKPNKGNKPESKSENGNSDSDSGDNKSNSNSNKEDDFKFKYIEVIDEDGEKYKIPYNTHNKKELERMKDREGEMFDRAKSLWENCGLEKGNIPEGLANYLNELFKVEIPWETLVENAILYQVQIQGKKTWFEKNIYMPKTIRLPGHKNNDMSTVTLIACVDTSGSVMSRPDDLKKFLGILLSCIPHFRRLLLIWHDYKIAGNPIDLKDTRYNEEEIKNELKKIYGGGGTSHEDVFNYIENLYNDDEQISNVVFLTDYYSDVEEIHRKYEWIKNIPTIWILNSNLEVNLNGTEEYKQFRIN